jgi:hypothetical protein
MASTQPEKTVAQECQRQPRCGRGGVAALVVDGFNGWTVRMGIAAYCKPENKVPLGFVEGLNNKIRVLQRRPYGIRDEEYLRLKFLTCMLPEI